MLMLMIPYDPVPLFHKRFMKIFTNIYKVNNQLFNNLNNRPYLIMNGRWNE
jgi:glycine betaine/choline ABC-type transport system substrate-binding protein